MSLPGPFPLAGKVAVVTGGSNGIGTATVRMLAEAGATVVIGYNSSRPRAETLCAELPGQGHSVQQITNESSASISALVASLHDKHGRCDILVNSGGTTRPVPHADLDQLTELCEALPRRLTQRSSTEQ